MVMSSSTSLFLSMLLQIQSCFRAFVVVSLVSIQFILQLFDRHYWKSFSLNEPPFHFLPINRCSLNLLRGIKKKEVHLQLEKMHQELGETIHFNYFGDNMVVFLWFSST